MHFKFIYIFLISAVYFALRTYEAEFCIDSSEVTCDYDSTQMRCTIMNNSVRIQEVLENCSYRRQLHIHFELNGEVTVALDTIISSVEHAWIIGSENAIVNLQIRMIHVNLTSLVLGGNFNLMTTSRFEDNVQPSVNKNFFEHFPSMQVLIVAGKFSFNFFPSFTSLRNLTILVINLLDKQGDRNTGFNLATSFNGSIVRGLGDLGALSWTGGALEDITSNAFEGVNSLTILALSNNSIHKIEANAFAPLTRITNINLDNNIIQNVTGPLFNMLTRLQTLKVSNNPFFPLESLRGCNATEIFLNNNGYETLRQRDFQSLTSRPVSIEMVGLLVCNCSLKWTAEVREFGTTFIGAFCKAPRSELGKQLQFATYNGCNKTQIMECGSENASCPYGKSCLVNETGSYCVCPEGFVFNHTALQCEDVDECEVGNGRACQHTCTNTEGSYNCSCNNGYQLSLNGHECEDMNECLINNGGCEFACINTEGGYDCICRNGGMVDELGNCMEINPLTEQVSIWGVVTSIFLFLIITINTILFAVFCILYCRKRHSIKVGDSTPRPQINQFDPPYVNTHTDMNPEMRRYVIVEGNANGLNIQTNNWGEERIQAEGEYYII